MTPPLPEFRSRLRRPYRHSLPRRSPRSISRQPKALITLVPSSSGRRRQLVRRLRGDGFSQSISLRTCSPRGPRVPSPGRRSAGSMPGLPSSKPFSINSTQFENTSVISFTRIIYNYKLPIKCIKKHFLRLAPEIDHFNSGQ